MSSANVAGAAAAGRARGSDGLFALATALPADLSHSPVLGIAGVVSGAGIGTLAGRLLSLGLADFIASMSVAALIVIATVRRFPMNYRGQSWAATAFAMADSSTARPAGCSRPYFRSRM